VSHAGPFVIGSRRTATGMSGLATCFAAFVKTSAVAPRALARQLPRRCGPVVSGGERRRPSSALSVPRREQASVGAGSSPSEIAPRIDPATIPKLPFRFETGVALFAKRPPRPFPPPFLSPPSGSFSDPLSTHDRSRDRRASYVNGELIQGTTNGDDAVFASEYFICANDGVGAWTARVRGHAG
jgi:hypothetical protein